MMIQKTIDCFAVVGFFAVILVFCVGICYLLAYLPNRKQTSKSKKQKNEDKTETGDSIYLPPPVKKILRFSKKCLLYSFIAVGLFTVATIILHNTAVGVPDTLITEFIGFFKIEGGILGGIKITETITDKIFDLLLSKKGDKQE